LERDLIVDFFFLNTIFLGVILWDFTPCFCFGTGKV